MQSYDGRETAPAAAKPEPPAKPVMKDIPPSAIAPAPKPAAKPAAKKANVIDTLNAEMAALAKKPAKAPAAKKTTKPAAKKASTKKDPLLG